MYKAPFTCVELHERATASEPCTLAYLYVEWELVKFHVLHESAIDSSPFNDSRLSVMIELHCSPFALFRITVNVLYQQFRIPVFFPINLLGILLRLQSHETLLFINSYKGLRGIFKLHLFDTT